MSDTRRREFITLILGAAAWPLPARAQQAALPMIGILNGGAPSEYAHFVAAFRQSLSDVGYVEGRNLAIDYRSAEGHYDRLPALAAELVRKEATVILAIGGGASALAAKAATAVIPIVFANGSDPVGLGLVASMNRPGANVTGVSWFGSALEAKRLEFLHELVPQAAKIGFLVNLSNPNGDFQVREVKAAADAVGKQVQALNASTNDEIVAAFAMIAQQRIGALQVAIDPFLLNRRDQLVALAARHAVPAIYALRDYVVAGGHASYGNSLVDGYRQAGVYTSRILQGAKPADLPVIRPTKFELVINLKTAKALRIEVPPSLLALADEVIE
jgi:putative tryptophan/tyrosine transport system substrate-binding protein